jgi:hypothetical protein
MTYTREMSLNKLGKLVQLVKTGARPRRRFVPVRVKDSSAATEPPVQFIAGPLVDGEVAAAKSGFQNA